MLSAGRVETGGTGKLVFEFGAFSGVVARSSLLSVVGFGAILSVSWAQLTFGTGHTVFVPVLTTSCRVCSLHAGWALQRVNDTWWTVVISWTSRTCATCKVLACIAQITVSIKLQVITRGSRWTSTFSARAWRTESTRRASRAVRQLSGAGRALGPCRARELSRETSATWAEVASLAGGLSKVSTLTVVAWVANLA